jgi:hypothetical protein
MAVAAVVAAYLLAFVAADPSTAATLTKLGTWSPLLGVLGLLAVQALVCVAIIRYFLVYARAAFHPWATLIAPVLGGLAMIGGGTLLLANRGALSGAGDAPFVRAMPWVILTLFGAGVVAALVFRARHRVAYDSIGSWTSFHD